MAEEIIGTSLRFPGDMEQFHGGFVEGTSPLAPIARRTGTGQIVPPMLPAQATWFDMVYGQLSALLAAVLTRVVISSEHLLLAESDMRARSSNHVVETNDGGAQDRLCRCFYITTPIFYDFGLAHNDQDDSATSTADIDGFIVSVQYQDRRVHHYHTPIDCC